jgi:hypothetical protein
MYVTLSIMDDKCDRHYGWNRNLTSTRRKEEKKKSDIIHRRDKDETGYR